MNQNTALLDDEIFQIHIDETLIPYMVGAATRLSYIERNFTLEVVGPSFRVTAKRPSDQPAIVRKINHALYREKVQAESAPLRARFLELLSHR